MQLLENLGNTLLTDIGWEVKTFSESSFINRGLTLAYLNWLGKLWYYKFLLTIKVKCRANTHIASLTAQENALSLKLNVLKRKFFFPNC